MARCYYLDYESNGNLKLLPHYEREDSEQIHSDSSKSIRTISKIIIGKEATLCTKYFPLTAITPWTAVVGAITIGIPIVGVTWTNPT